MRRESLRIKHNSILLGFILLLLACLCPQCVKAATSVEISIPVKMEYHGDTPQSFEQLTITLKADDSSYPMPEGSAEGIKTITISANGSGNLGSITYNKAGVYTYTARLESGSDTTCTYDGRIFTIKVLVTNVMGQNGAYLDKLETQVLISDENGTTKYDKIEFLNSYKINSIDESDDTTLVISKTVTGNAPANDTYTFTLNLTGSAAEERFVYTDEAGEKIGIISSGENITLHAGEKVRIQSIPIGTAYGVAEIQKAWYTPSPLSGVFSGVIQEGENTAAFTNHYDKKTSSPVSVDPPVEKQISGDKPKTNTRFTFCFERIEEDNPMPEGAVAGKKAVSIDGAGSTEFGWITYTKTGVYHYRSYEVKQTTAGYTYDDTIFLLTVTVTEKDGKLSASRSITRQDGVSVSKLLFVNQYKAGGGTTFVSKVTSSFASIVKTGDATKILPFIVLAVMAVCVIILALRKKKEEKEDGEEYW